MMKFLRRFGDLGINGLAARWYDKNSRNHRLDEMRQYAKKAAEHLHDGDSVLEIAPGPGYLSIELSKLENYEITGMDISGDFVEIARKNAREADAHVEFRQGNVSDMPFQDNTFDFIICTAAFKNFKQPLKALNEMNRVLKMEGEVLIIDMKRDASDQEIDTLTRNMKEKGAEAVFMKFMFKHFLRKGAYTKDEISRLIAQTAFGDYRVDADGVTLSIDLRKKARQAPNEPLTTIQGRLIRH